MDPRDDPGVALARHYASEAEAYRELWAPVLVRLALNLLSSLPMDGTRRVLDLGCGVGALLPHHRMAAPRATVVGLDRSEGMVRLASREFPLLVGDAARLPFVDASFDVMTLSFMLFHLQDPAAGLHEVRRVLRPGGSVGILTWGGETTARAYLAWDEELLGHGAPETGPKLAWHENVDTPRKVARLLRSAGFTDVTSRPEVDVDRPSREEFVARRLRLGQCRRRLEALDERARSACVERALRRLDDMGPEDFEEENEVIVTVARRPG